jgi:hypothetical protein
MAVLLYLQGKNSWYVVNSRLSRPQCQSAHFGKDKNLFPMPEIKSQSIPSLASPQFTEKLKHTYTRWFKYDRDKL